MAFGNAVGIHLKASRRVLSDVVPPTYCFAIFAPLKSIIGSALFRTVLIVTVPPLYTAYSHFPIRTYPSESTRLGAISATVLQRVVFEIPGPEGFMRSLLIDVIQISSSPFIAIG